MTSPTFYLLIKSLDFPTNINASTSTPFYGCTDEITLSLPETPCVGSFCGLTQNVSGFYNITWQLPTGWTLISSTNKGSEVTFLPDPFSEGDITATIHFTPCDFQERRTLHITRPKKIPEFTQYVIRGCTNSSIEVGIEPLCGAVNYTYSISGNPGVTFASTGLQTLTTTQTQVDISLSGGSSYNSLSVKSNYSDNTSSPEAQKPITVYSGSPSIGGSYVTNGQLHFLQYAPADNPVCLCARNTLMMSVNNYTNVIWSRISSYPGNVDYNQFGNNLAIYLWVLNQTATFRITASNPCGSISNDFRFKAINCSSGGGGGCLQYQIAPNPASGFLNIVIPDVPAPCDAAYFDSNPNHNTPKQITGVKVWDNMGNLKKTIEGNGTNRQRIDVSGLKKGVYLIEIINKNNSKKHQVILQ